MITSQQVNQMHMASMQAHGAAPGMMPSQPMMGMSQYPPTFSYSMAGQQNPNERVGRRAAGAMVGAVQGGLGVASMANMGLGVAGMFGLAATTGPVGWAGGLTAGLGIMGAQATVGAAARGMQYGGQVNQMFGNQQFANAANPMGRGFNSGQLHQMFGAVRAIEKDDPFVNMKDALRVTEKFGGQFGIQQGVRDAEKLSARVTELGKTLSKMAKTMGTTIDEAGDIMGMSRNAGFYTAQDVMGNTQDFMFNRGRGFTSQQTGQIQATGAGGSRSIGLTGKSGATFATRMVQDLSLMGEAGTIDQNALMDMTGAIDPNSAATAFAGRTQEIFQSTMGSGIGMGLLGALGRKDKSGRFTGEIDQALLRDMNSGNVDFTAVRNQGQRNISSRAGRESFVENKDQILGSMMESGEGLQALINVIEQTAEEQGKSSQLIFEQITGGNAREFRMLTEVASKVEATRSERVKSMALDAQMQSYQQHLRENATIGGITQQFFGGIQDRYISPIEDAGARFSANMGSAGEGVRQATLRMMGGGTASFSTSAGQLSGVQELLEQVSSARNDKGEIDLDALERMGISTDRAKLVMGGGGGVSSTDQLTLAASGGRTGDLGAGLASHLEGTSAASKTANMSAQDKARIRTKISEANKETNPEKKAALLKKIREDVNYTLNPASEQQIRASMMHGDKFGGTGGRITASATESKDTLDAVIAEVGSEVGLQVVQAGRAETLGLGKSGLYGDTIKTQDELHELFGTSTTYDQMKSAAMIGAVATVNFGGISGAVIGAIGAAAMSDGVGDIISGGGGVELIGQATSAGKMKEIDQVISASAGDDAAAAVRLSKQLGIKVTASDVKAYRAIMKGKTGEEAEMRVMNSSDDEEGYGGKYGAVFKMAGEANLHTEALAAQKLTESTKAMSIELVGDLRRSGVEGLSDAVDSLSSSNSLLDYSDNLQAVIKAAADSGLTMESLDKDAGLAAQLLAQSSEKISEVRGLADSEGQISVDALKESLGVAPGSRLADRIDGMGEEEQTVTADQAEALALEISGRGLTAAARDGAEGLTTALQSGKSPLEIQTQSVKDAAESVRKNAEMIDTIYARMTNSPPAVPDSAVAANAGWTMPPGGGQGEWKQ